MADVMVGKIKMPFDNNSNFMFDGQSSPNRSTEVSSDDEKNLLNDFDSFSQMTPSLSRKCSKNENGWKRKVKTELCKFWLSGLECENQHKEQGCGFAHGQDELQKKKGLSNKYMTSVCKNFLDHPSKCTYGQRCIFQHPTHDIRQRQNYTDMIRDNSRYTAMRLFQEIEGADCIYINTYAATTPRLPVFRSICNNAKDNGEDHIDEEEYYAGTESGDYSDSYESNDSFREDSEESMSVFSTIKHELFSHQK